MSNVLTKLVSNKISRYFSKLSLYLTKPELRCVREIVVGILKSQETHINKIASAIRDEVSLHQTSKRFRNHYNKPGFFLKLFRGHIESVKGRINNGDYIFFDGSDIQKRYARFMEGLDFVKDGDKGTIGLGYWLMNAVHFTKDGTLTPLFNKLYSFDCGAKSENKEVLEAIKETTLAIKKKVTSIFDRGMDRPVCRDYIISNAGNFILRLKGTTKLFYKRKELNVKTISRKVVLFMEQKAVKAGRNGKPYMIKYDCGAVKVRYETGKECHELWLVVLKRKDGGYGWLLTRSPYTNIVQVIEEAFTAYGLRWKIEEYHRHIKSQYKLEQVQIKTFEGLQSMLALLTVAMGIVYAEASSLHIRLITQSGIKTCNKEKLHELYNFVYYKIGTIIKVLLAALTPRAFLPTVKPLENTGQLCLTLNFET